MGTLQKSSRNRNTIGVDVDQVVANLHDTWLARYNATYKDTLTLEDITEWSMHKFVKPECDHKIYNYLRMPNLYMDVDPCEGAVEGIQTLRDSGYRVVFVTSCVIGSMDMKARWLQNNGFLSKDRRSHPDLILAKDKSLINVDILVDDGPHNVRQFPGPTILVDQPYNREIDHPHRAHNWSEIVEHIEDLQMIPGVDFPN